MQILTEMDIQIFYMVVEVESPLCKLMMTEGFTEISGNEYVFSQRSNFVDINNDGH